ncbi:Fic family protein [Nocardioides alcanivorans]|uniref:Fic family protein n=1 Tax=Nocardioides alcanivorans TaxID=2897352 RepID=UPI0035E148C2
MRTVSARSSAAVPPPPRTVGGYLDDLIGYANRDDVGAMEQAAIVHGQFESVHPFTDGNGRIGRALINTVLRQRGVTTKVVIPLASAVVARRDDYFRALGDYRDGDATGLVAAFTRGSTIAARESRVTADRLAALPEQWRDEAGRPGEVAPQRRSWTVSLRTPSSLRRTPRTGSVAPPQVCMRRSTDCGPAGSSAP